jgi:hypothetical protein
VPVPDVPIPGRTDFFLSECSGLKDPGRFNCYARGLLGVVERSRDPARELPVIDRKVRANGGFLQASCHMLMHQVGRTWARRHGVTLGTLYRYVPRSNDPGCSAGFGMGLVMHLGTALVLEPRRVVPICGRLPTRFREYTCVHGAGHALMRGYHGQLRGAVTACRALGSRHAPDCAQGAFHDYWISLSGGDGTKRPDNADTDPRSICARTDYPRGCWYRYFWQRRPTLAVDDPRDVRALCGDLAGLQRSGCLGAASLMITHRLDPIDHARVCVRLGGVDAVSCMRGVNVPALAGRQPEQLRLVRACAGLRDPEARSGCHTWFARTLNVVTNGAFGKWGCRSLARPADRAACAEGARRIGDPLRTFS